MAALAALAGIPGTGRAAEARLNGIAAIVNDRVITVDEVTLFTQTAIEAALRSARDQADLDRQVASIRRDALEILIDRRLIVSEYKNPVPESIVDELVNDRIRREYVDRVTLTKTLRETGRTYANFRKEQAEELVYYTMIRNHVAQEIVVSPRKMELYYAANRDRFKVEDRVHVRMIYVDARKHARGEAVEIAREAHARIKAGADFAAVANEVSDDVRTYKGGDHGWIARNGTELRKELRDAAFALEPGAVGDVIVIDGTAWIIKAEAKEVAHTRTLAEVRGEIEKTLRDQERNRLQKSWIGRLRKKAFIRYL